MLQPQRQGKHHRTHIRHECTNMIARVKLSNQLQAQGDCLAYLSVFTVPVNAIKIRTGRVW